MNFLHKGLAGLESRLDKVLLDDSERQHQHQHQHRRQQPDQPPPPPPPRRSTDSGGRRSVDRPSPAAAAAPPAGARMTMQERLAAAVAKKDGGGTASPVPSMSGEQEPEEEEGGAAAGREDGCAREEELEGVPREELVAMVRRLRAELQSQSRAEEGERVRKAAPVGGGSGGGGTADSSRKLAEAQEKIALLLEEGEKLSRGELKLRNTIKELRARTQEEEKGALDARRRADKAEREAAEARDKVKRAAEEAKRDRERLKSVARLESELQALRSEKDGFLAAMAELKARVEEGARRAEEAESRAQTEALETERQRAADLAAELEQARADAAATEARLGVEIADLKSKVARDAERARSMEQELKAEQTVMERKMEALRARAEEVSSGASGDAHAKLLRQVETLQTQYAIASENWQGIEGSMLGRIAGLEKERDELARKEADVRRKARDLSIKSKNLDMDLETATSRIKDLESDLGMAQQSTSTLQARLTAGEAELAALRSSLDHERAAWQRDLEAKLAEERQKWADGSQSRPASPLNLNALHLHTAAAAPPSLPPLRKSSGPLSTTESYFVGSARKPSRSPGAAAEPSAAVTTPTDHFSRRGFSTPPIGIGVRTATTTSLSLPTAPEEDDDYFANIPFSPRRGDLASVSTVAAGPSVQLVERMSATVRRLEGEMAGAREELAAVARQRDEARREIVELVRESEGARGARRELAEMRRREETALEMLGEKSELVEELRADVQDLKQMYRDLVSGFGK